MSFRALVEEVRRVATIFPGVQVCIDRYMAAEVENELLELGITVVEVAQGAKTQSEPMRELEAAVLDGRIEHDASPVAAMCVANLLADAVGLDAIKPARENEHKKIDVAVAIINALTQARGGGESEAHVGNLLM
jgi:phage terminase large subunit-like protein